MSDTSLTSKEVAPETLAALREMAATVAVKGRMLLDLLDYIDSLKLGLLESQKQSRAVRRQGDDLYNCEFCGCHTNARQRACCDAGRAADKARSAQPPDASRWISAKERKPTHIYSVLAWMIGPYSLVAEAHADVVIWNPNRQQWQCGGLGTDDDADVQVTHWMDLPTDPNLLAIPDFLRNQDNLRAEREAVTKPALRGCIHGSDPITECCVCYPVEFLPAGVSDNTGPVAGRVKPKGEPGKPEKTQCGLAPESTNAVVADPDRLSVSNNRQSDETTESPK